MYGQAPLPKKEDINPSAVQTPPTRASSCACRSTVPPCFCTITRMRLREVGLDPENPPTTLAEIADACEKLTVTGQRQGNPLRNERGSGPLCDGEPDRQPGRRNLLRRQRSGRAGLITKLTCEKELRNVYDAWEKLAATGGLKYNYDNQNEEVATGKNAMTLNVLRPDRLGDQADEGQRN